MKSIRNIITKMFNFAAQDSRAKSGFLNVNIPAAGIELESNEFNDYLKTRFDEGTAKKVIAAFEQINLPLPKNGDEFLQGTEGGLMFLSKYGLVLRIEDTNTRKSKSGYASDRINDSAFILKPIASIDCGKAVIELCPGTKLEENESNVAFLFHKLQAQNINYWDDKICNSGVLPIKTPSFPNGVPVVIDRLAARRLFSKTKKVKCALVREADHAQEVLYAPLRKAFLEGWQDPSKMGSFWSKCEKYVAKGKLVAGWEFDRPRMDKAKGAKITAGKYGARLQP